MTEVELKLSLDAAAAAKLARSRALASPGRRRRLTSIYFDTENGLLARNAMALRLRKSGRRWTQSLKAGESGAGGLHARDEWELERPGPTLDLSLFAATPLARLEGAERLHKALVPVFEVDVVRTTWKVRPAPGQRLEVALDEGVVASRGGERTDAISEVEIECIDAPAAAAYAFAERLLDDVALRPSPTTKAERGYRLFHGREREPVKAVRAALAPGMTPEAAARAIVSAAMAQLQANEEGALAADDPEFVHQARVALRRLRTALRLFRDAIGTRRARKWRRALGATGRALGEARDWDVFAEETLPSLLRGLATAVTAKRLRRRTELARAAVREHARDALRSPAYARVMLELSRWIGAEPGPQEGAERLDAFAARLLRKRHKRLVASAARLRHVNAAARHRARIHAKRLRYFVDGMGGVFSEERVAAYADALSDLQDELGRANDAATASRLLETLGPPRAFAARAAARLARRMRPGARLDAIAARIAQHGEFW